MTWIPPSRLLPSGRAPTHPIAIRGGTPIPFARFQADIAAAAARLAGCRHAALACDDTYLFAVGLLALLHAGADITLPPNTQPGTLADLTIPIVNDALIATAPAASLPLTQLDANRNKITFHTSGSTGAPKLIDKTLDTLHRESETLHQAFGPHLGTGPVHATVTHQHLYGLAFRLLWPLAAGIPFDADTDAVWETLLPKLQAGTMIVSSPAHLTRLAGLNRIHPERAPTLILTAGAPLSTEAARTTQTLLGRLPTEIFGSTETGAIATRQQHHGDEPWTSFPDTQIRTDSRDRMVVRTPYTDGWQQTQDVIAPLPTGFRFLGRADRIVKVEGQRISLPAIESALQSLPWVNAAAVIALPTSLGAVLVLTAEGQTQRAALGPYHFTRHLRRLLSAHLQPAGLPRLWRIANSLPTRTMGKRDDAAIAALFQDAT